MLKKFWSKAKANMALLFIVGGAVFQEWNRKK